MSTPLGPAECKANDRVADKYIVKKKIGEGACGQIFLVAAPDKDGKIFYAAMKIEPRMKQKEDEILKMELLVLKRSQSSRHVCRLLAHGLTPTYTYVIMSLLGPDISDCRRRCPNRKFSHNSTLRLAIQGVKALQDLHEVGFVHRDVKPPNLAMGYTNPLFLYLLDFGLARQILVDNVKGGKKLREERPRTMFRGTVRYCSINVHQQKEQGRHDDLIGLMHSLIECISALPWRGNVRKEAAKLKEKTSEATLCKDCPPSFTEIMKILKKIKYVDIPPYANIIKLLKGNLPPNIKMTEPYEWTKKSSFENLCEKNGSGRDRAEYDKGGSKDRLTINDVDDSVVTDHDSKDSGDEGDFPGNDDTLEGM